MPRSLIRISTDLSLRCAAQSDKSVRCAAQSDKNLY